MNYSLFEAASSDAPRTAPSRIVDRATNYVRLEKNSRKGFFDLHLTCGMVIRRCVHHDQGHGPKVQLPAREYIDPNGAIRPAYIFSWADDETKQRFNAEARQALLELLGVRQ
ncbi:hypothetical protein WOC76_04265 [Methylocystis sp. IM3]|uniref:hypothetical protein n=1 Tax=unclassified Methylocystis TaxID=2625913 RepID=UPI0030FB3392